MGWVHGRSRVTSGASRLHHVAGVTRVTPGGPTNKWQGLQAQQPPTGLLASKWVLQKNLSTASTPVAMTGLVGFGICRPWRLANMEAISEGRTKSLIPRLSTSTYQETRLWGLKEHLGNAPRGPLPSQICSPPWPNPLWAPSWTKRTLDACWTLPFLPCIRREGATVRAGKLLTAPSRDVFRTSSLLWHPKKRKEHNLEMGTIILETTTWKFSNILTVNLHGASLF